MYFTIFTPWVISKFKISIFNIISNINRASPRNNNSIYDRIIADKSNIMIEFVLNVKDLSDNKNTSVSGCVVWHNLHDQASTEDLGQWMSPQ
jgi:hypothetical protein